MKETLRKCQGCGQLKDRSLLIKITKLQNGSLKINPTSKELGRSVYVCNDLECVKKFIKKKRLKLGLKCSTTSEIEKIEKELSDIIK